MFKATDGYVLMSSDYSQQEPKVMTQMCHDPEMLQAYLDGKDLYSQIASVSFHRAYRDCLEFVVDDNLNPVFDEKGNKITNKEGKSYRSQAKSILLGILYGRGDDSVAEQLGCSVDEAKQIKASVFEGFPAIAKFEQDSLSMARELGFVTTLWGRKRRLPDLQLPDYSFEYINPSLSFDPLDFENEEALDDIPENIKNQYTFQMNNARGYKARDKVIASAEKQGIRIISNVSKKGDAQRQCVNARIQGSAADLSKLAMVLVGNDKQMKEWGFRLLIPVHDELIGECPREYAKECSERLAFLMAEAARGKLEMPIKSDVTVTYCWYGEEIEL